MFQIRLAEMLNTFLFLSFLMLVFLNYVSKITVSYFLILRISLVVEVDSKIYTQQPGFKPWSAAYEADGVPMYHLA